MEAQITSTKTNGKQCSSDQLLQALYFIFDQFDRAMIPFFATHDTAKAILNDQPLTGDGIDVGVKQKDMHQSGLEIMELFWKSDNKTDNLIHFTFEGVPVRVHIYKHENVFIKNPNLIMYNAEGFCVPNQFDKYWKLRNTMQ